MKKKIDLWNLPDEYDLYQDSKGISHAMITDWDYIGEFDSTDIEHPINNVWTSIVFCKYAVFENPWNLSPEVGHGKPNCPYCTTEINVWKNLSIIRNKIVENLNKKGYVYLLRKDKGATGIFENKSGLEFRYYDSLYGKYTSTKLKDNEFYGENGVLSYLPSTVIDIYRSKKCLWKSFKELVNV